MRDRSYQFYATDNDIFDLLTCTKRKLTEGVLREIAGERGIFFSPHDGRDEIALAISQLPFTLNELIEIMHRRETPRRNEKTTHITLNDVISVDELKAAISAYKDDFGSHEKISSYQKSPTSLVLNVQYDDMDYSRTRLIQRQRHDASIEFIQKDGKTVVRLPASEKSKRIIEDLTRRIEGQRRTSIDRHLIELPQDFTADERTMFFTRLIAELPGHKLIGVTNLKIAPSARPEGDTEDTDIDEDEREEASHEMLVIVRSMALSGENLIASKEYQSLRTRGFYITSIDWKSQQINAPYDVAHLHASFEDGENGKGFKYAAKGVYRCQTGVYTKTLRPLDDTEREKLYVLVETAAHKILREMQVARSAVVTLSEETVR
ncbi:hypothetical protein [Zoogloea sp. LCSB751]|uniref:hypothetical protein n=1 Tax=Zoogloea sp. LCSB751 TaxID=1965277 RepID=UPI001117A272|nr:hypothetical protein [Zoogloea sp. LCSB751]